MSSGSPVRQSLYLKYRPQRFRELVGQEVVAQTLRNAVREGRLSHAYLFGGIRGTGKTSAARILAKAINCESPEEGEPCCRCAPCRAIAAQASMDVIEIDAASNRGIDEIRELRERAQFVPSQFKTKVYIIDEAHRLTPDASNAFLKTLEEPPQHACFVLATTEPQNLLDTLRSRCQRYDFRRIPKEAVAGHLAEICRLEGVSATPEALELVAEAATGSLRDAESLLERLIGLSAGEIDAAVAGAGLGAVDPRTLERLAAALAVGDLSRAWGELHLLEAAGVEPRQLARELGQLARGNLWRGLRAPSGEAGDDAPQASTGFWLQLMSALAAAGPELRRADDPWMALEAALLRLSARAGSLPEAGPPAPGESGRAAAPPAPPPAGPEPALSEALPTAPRHGGAPESDGQAPAEEPLPERGPAGGQGAVGRWDEILAWLRTEHAPTHTLALLARPRLGSEGQLELEMDDAAGFYGKRLDRPADRAIVERACREVLGEELRVRVVSAAPAAAPAEAPDRAAGAAAESSPDLPGASAVSQAMSVFPGSRVTRLGTPERR